MIPAKVRVFVLGCPVFKNEGFSERPQKINEQKVSENANNALVWKLF